MQKSKDKRAMNLKQKKYSTMNAKVFHTLIERLRDAIFIVDAKTNQFLDVNSQACASLGYKREELLAGMGVTDIDAVMPNRASWVDHVRKVREKGSLMMEGRHIRKDGIEFPVEINISIVELDKEYIVAAVRDITDRKKAEEKLKEAAVEWQKTFDSITDLIFMQDENFTITKVNRAFAETLKLKPEEIVGKKCYEILHKRNAPWDNCPFEQTRKDKKSHTEEVDDPGIGIPLLITTSPIFDPSGKFIGSVHIAKDISGIKKTENDLKEKLNQLEKFNKVAVGRELRMRELKEKITELEKKVNDK